jgi:hypothetical protein
MRRGIAKVAAISVLAVVPAVALADSTTYSGAAFGDPLATIDLKITNGSDRKVTKVVVKGLPYGPSGCTGSGRTPKATLKGDFRVKDNGNFKAIGGGETNDPLTDGEIKVVAGFGAHNDNRITGTMKFTFGKDGCDSEKLNFKATG